MFSALLCMGRCKHLGSLNSFLSYASQLSGGIVLPFRVLWAQKWTCGGPESQMAVTSFLDMAGDTPFHKGKSLLEQHLVVSDLFSSHLLVALQVSVSTVQFDLEVKKVIFLKLNFLYFGLMNGHAIFYRYPEVLLCFKAHCKVFSWGID